ncbi:MAG: nuclear transport factor 2 family protein [Actinomycetota bacterium]
MSTERDGAGIVRDFFERMEARDWDGARALVSPSVRIDYTETGERFDGSNFVGMNEAYPEGWTIRVVEALGVGDRVAAQVRVALGDEVFWCAGFYTVVDGVIADGVEHWVTERSADPPDWRERFTTPGGASLPTS